MSSVRSGSVLFVIESSDIIEASFAEAQRFAVHEQLPFAVVYCVEETDPVEQLRHISRFHDLESFLKPYAIPLMILIGARDTVLPWMSGHVKPVRVFTEKSTIGMDAKLQIHPIAWPGRVMTVAELEALVSGNDAYCRPS